LDEVLVALGLVVGSRVVWSGVSGGLMGWLAALGRDPFGVGDDGGRWGSFVGGGTVVYGSGMDFVGVFGDGDDLVVDSGVGMAVAD
jgi:hypothetical protein